MLKAIITGVAGQDGSYLSELLLEKDYTVIGISRRKGVESGYINIKHLFDHPNFKLVSGDITDPTLIYRLLHDYKPHEFYNLAAASNVGQSFKDPVSSFEVNATAVITQLAAIKEISPYTRYYQASTSELWGGLNCPQEGYSETDIFNPRSPYAIGKLAAYSFVKNYREAYGLFACNGILTNHSSPRRGLDFATRKITKGVASVKLGLQKTIKMGNLSAYRDEGHSKDFVLAMWKILQQEEPEDFVIATGDGATIKEMLEYVCQLAELDINEVYEQDQEFMRPSDVQYLKGNPTKAKNKLGWQSKISWKDLLKEMYISDLATLKDGRTGGGN